MKPVSTLATPPGRSEVASTSASEIAGSGRRSEATITALLPVQSTGASTLTKPSRLDSCGAMMATTPVGSGSEKLKYGPAIGLAEPATWANLSAQPAYQTMRSIDSPTLGERGAPRVDALGRPRPRRRTARGGRRASRPRGRSPGRGCTASPPTSPGTPCGRRRRRRARPCARPARPARAAPRRRPRPGRSGPTPSAGRRRRSRACRSCARAGARRRRRRQRASR